MIITGIKGKSLFRVINPNTFKNSKIIVPDTNQDRVFYLMQNLVANSSMEEKFQNWLLKHRYDYAFRIVEKQGKYYAVAYAYDIKAMYAIEVNLKQKKFDNNDTYGVCHDDNNNKVVINEQGNAEVIQYIKNELALRIKVKRNKSGHVPLTY